MCNSVEPKDIQIFSGNTEQAERVGPQIISHV